MAGEEILAGESKNVEFKVTRPEKRIKYMKPVVAFANGKGGRIVFGIADETKESVGIPEENIFLRDGCNYKCNLRWLDVTKNILLNWGALAENEDGSIYPINAYLFLMMQDAFLSKIQCGMFKGTTHAVLRISGNMKACCGSRQRKHFSLSCGIFVLDPKSRDCIVRIFINFHRTAFVSLS